LSPRAALKTVPTPAAGIAANRASCYNTFLFHENDFCKEEIA
jgi:hypothetical protein